MSEIFNWLIHIPEYMAEFGKWLTSPVMPGWEIGGVPVTPLGLFGVSAGTLVVGILILHIIHLVNPLG